MQKENLQKLYYKYRFYIFPVVVVICSVVLLAVVIYPQARKIMDISKAQVDTDGKAAQVKAKVDALNSLNSSDLTTQMNVLLTVLPEDKDYPGLIQILKNTILSRGLILVDFQVGGSGSAAAKSSGLYTVMISLKGTKSAVDDFISSVEALPRMIRIQNLDFNLGKAPDIVTANITLNIFYAPAPTAVGAVDSPLPKLTEKDQQMVALFTRGINLSSPPVSTSSAKGKADLFN